MRRICLTVLAALWSSRARGQRVLCDDFASGGVLAATERGSMSGKNTGMVVATSRRTAGLR